MKINCKKNNKNLKRLIKGVKKFKVIKKINVLFQPVQK